MIDAANPPKKRGPYKKGNRMNAALIFPIIFAAMFFIGLFTGQLVVARGFFDRRRATNPRMYWLVQFGYAFCAVLSGAMALRLL